ncbi:hypothetical protein GGR57DRAFT_202653 [Xylariaceae sp. FL1272]|nr:hypothetical protein GGR57DRAFT_202653 [Xylariaceae sp. FL1272]
MKCNLSMKHICVDGPSRRSLTRGARRTSMDSLQVVDYSATEMPQHILLSIAASVRRSERRRSRSDRVGSLACSWACKSTCIMWGSEKLGITSISGMCLLHWHRRSRAVVLQRATPAIHEGRDALFLDGVFLCSRCNGMTRPWEIRFRRAGSIGHVSDGHGWFHSLGKGTQASLLLACDEDGLSLKTRRHAATGSRSKHTVSCLADLGLILVRRIWNHTIVT